KSGYGWDKLLKGRTGRVFINMDANPWITRILFGDNSNEIRNSIFGFAGIKTRVTKIGPLKEVTPEKKENWKKMVFEMGKKAQ
ncbi:MAG: flavodoxin family protein, partial [Patescibacteria group bacterium]